MKARFLALAALVLGLASCQQEFNDVAQLGGEVDFQLKVDAAELGTTRAGDSAEKPQAGRNSAYGAIDYLQGSQTGDDCVDWEDVDLRYSLEVYDYEEGNYKDAVPVKDRMVKIVDAYEPVVFDLRLVPGRNYHFVVFADFVPQGATVESTEGVAFTEHQSTLGIHHTIGDNLRSIKIKADAINDECCDAYFATEDVEVKHQALNVKDIVLKRPYGKLRVIATDLAELNLNVDPAWVEVTYTAKHPQKFNAVTGNVTKFEEGKEYVLSSTYKELYKDVEKGGLANHFYNAGYDNTTTTNADGVERHTHMTLFTDYILGSNTVGEQTPVQFTMTVYDKQDNPIKTTQFNTTIPIERNHLTTIVGNVLTSATEITVTIDDNFANADNPTDAPYYQVAVENGFEFVNAYYSGLKMFALNDITVRAKDVADYNATRSGDVINPSIDLNGYTLTFVTDSEKPLLEVPEGGSFTITDSEGTGEVKVEGTGTAIENKGTVNLNIDDAKVADNAIKTTESGFMGSIVYTLDELETALETASDDTANKFTLGADIEGNVTVVQQPNVKITIDGANKSLKGYITVDGKSATYTTAGLTIKNINFNADAINADACINLGVSGNNNTRYTCNVTADNCTFDVNGAVGVKSYTGGDKNLIIKNCAATSKAHSLVQAAGIDTINVVGCKVESKNGMNFNQSDNVAINGCKVDVKGYAVRYGVSSGTFNTAETYTISNSTLKSACEEEGDAVIVLRATADNATLTIENTTIEGTPEIINNAENATITFEGYNYCAEGLYKKGVEYYVTNANGLATLNAMMANQTAGRYVKVVLGNDIDFTGKTWTPVDSHADSAFWLTEINGQGHTISNLTINGQAMFTRFAGVGDVTIKDVTFDNATVTSNGINTSILTVQTYRNVLLDNVDVKNSSITGTYKVAPLIGTVYNESSSTITATLKNCDVEDVTVKATYLDFCTTGMVAFVNAGDNDTIAFENCTVKNVKLYAPNAYTAHAAIYTTGSETLFNEAEGVTVNNVTFENI